MPWGASAFVATGDTQGSFAIEPFRGPLSRTWTIEVKNAQLLVCKGNVNLQKGRTEDVLAPEDSQGNWRGRYVGNVPFTVSEYTAFTRLVLKVPSKTAYGKDALRFSWYANCTMGFEETSYKRCVSKIPCKAGYYLSDVDYRTCLPCPLGTFSNVTGGRFLEPTCKRCPAGLSTDKEGSTLCERCPNGTFTDLVNVPFGQYACVPCPAGTYHGVALGTRDASVCLTCPGGYASAVEGVVECAPCAAGTYTDGPGQQTCSQCPRGSYSSEVAASSKDACQTCPAGKYSPLPGASTESLCTSCPPGRYFLRADVECPTCPVGTFSPEERSASCTDCPGGSYADLEGSPACALCPPGTASLVVKAVNASACLPCPAGRFASSSGSTACEPCSAGTFSAGLVGSSSCIACPPGTASATVGASSSTACVSCAPGKYAPANGTAACMACPVGTFANLAGMTACRPCPLSMVTAGTGTVRKSDCVASMPVSPTTGLCDAGYYALPGDEDARCVGCPSGKYSASIGSKSISSCLPCPRGLFAPWSGFAACVPCPSGSFVPPSDAEGSTYCLHDKYSAPLTGGRSLESGAIATGEGTKRRLCGNGTYSVLMATSLSSSNNSNNTTGCAPCVPGTIRVADTDPNPPVYPNVSALAIAAACKPCPAETYSIGYASSVCRPCYKSTSAWDLYTSSAHAPDPGSVSCSVLTPDVRKPDMTRGRQFPPLVNWTTYVEDGAQDWRMFLVTLLNATGAPVLFQDGTPITYYRRLPVPVGGFSMQVVAAEGGAPSYGTGRYVFSSLSVSDPLDANASSVFDGTTATWVSDARSDASKIFTVYTWISVFGSAVSARQQSATGQWVQIELPRRVQMTRYRFVGKWPTPDATIVPTGSLPFSWTILGSLDGLDWYFVWGRPSTSAMWISDWSVGEFIFFDMFYDISDSYANPITGHYYNFFRLHMHPLDAAAKAIALDEWQIFGMDMCDPGSFWFEASLSDDAGCRACPRGTYKAEFGGEQCTPCPVDTFAPASNATACTACSPGTYSPMLGSSSPCTPCPEGTYVNVSLPVPQGCSLCPASTTSLGGTASECTPCSQGTYALPGTGCLPCPAGTFWASSAAASACASCAAGKFSSGGATACTDCPSGSYANGWGFSSCTQCSPGTYSNAVGAGVAPLPTPAPTPAPTPPPVPCLGPYAYSCDSISTTHWCGLLAYSIGRIFPPAAIGLDPVTLTSSSVPYGSGTYTLLRGTDFIISRSVGPERVFMQSSPSGLMYPASYFAGSNGLYSGTSFIQDSTYKGVWVGVTLPLSIVLKRVTWGGRTNYPGSQVKAYRIYARVASTGGAWDMLLDNAGAEYATFDAAATDFIFHDTGCLLASNAKSYDQYVVVARSYYGNPTYFIWTQLKFYDDVPPPPPPPAPTPAPQPPYACTGCEAGTFSNASGASACVACPAGSYASSSHASACAACAPGKTSASPGALSASACVDCVSGTYEEGNVCKKCPAGTASTQMGATSWETCKPCPSGEFSPSAGSAYCQKCAAGQRTF